MQPAISIGTLLQNRYRIVQLLGQGGFGRTYLAEDSGRFNEQCAIKEFVPIQGEDKFSDKATQLFQREASVLYQISHPQIPQFQATFEEEERLFLVQDYVEGPTYHQVLRQRQEQGRTFSETEIRQFLQQVLPVLAHIHAKGIIHRDVSPDNIILRQSDNRPVLIDFGVVKEVVTRLHLDGESTHATTVGKAGYAPHEQMQTGRAYPSSDLYALAVTAIVLLTGKEPQALFDDVNATWRWQDSATVSGQLAGVLNKALSYRPSDRFPAVKDMAQALQTGNTPIKDRAPAASNEPAANNLAADNLAAGMTGAVPRRPTPQGSAPRYPVQPPVSQMKTVAVGRPNPESRVGNSGNSTVNRPTTVRQGAEGLGTKSRQTNRSTTPPAQQQSSLLENPLAVGGLAIGLAAMAGFGGYAVVQTLDTAVTPTPTITSLPPIGSETPTPTPTPTPTQSAPTPVEYNQPQLALVPGVTKTVEGSMRGGDTVNYPLTAEARQTLSVEQFEEGVRLSVLGPNGKPVNRRAASVVEWTGELEEGGNYVVQLTPNRGVKSTNYRLAVTLSAPRVPEPIPEEPDEPEEPELPGNGETPDNPDVPPIEPLPTEPPSEEIPIEPQIQSQRVSFPAGADGVLVANSVGAGRIQRYIVNVREGQILSAEIMDAQGARVDFSVLMPGGEMIPDASGIVSWASILQAGGDYLIDVEADSAAEFTLEIRAENAGE
ncbi:MAG: protein kinase [Phormidesmis sp.]